MGEMRVESAEPGPRLLRVGPSGRVLIVAALLVALASAVLLVTGLTAERVISDTSSTLPAERLDELLRFDEALLAEIDAYRVPRRRVALVGLLIAVAVPAILASALMTDGAAPLVRAARRFPGTALPVGAIAAEVVLITGLVRLPLSVWSGVVQDGRYGFRTRSVPGWLLDQLVVLGGRALATGLLVAIVAALVLRHPNDWPARVTLLTAVAGLLAVLLHPIVAHPLLLPTRPLPEGEYREAVAGVLARSDLDVEVLIGEASRRTTRRNAVATGLGPTERVVLHDTLLELGPREVAAITAHEVAHLERRDPLRAALAPVPAVALLAVLVQRRLRGRPRPDVRSLAASVALVLALEAAATPLTAAVTRTVEHRTDVRSVVLSGDPEAHLVLLRAFVIDGLADPDPPRWSVLLWATHPTPSERMRAVSGVSGPATR